MTFKELFERRYQILHRVGPDYDYYIARYKSRIALLGYTYVTSFHGHVAEFSSQEKAFEYIEAMESAKSEVVADLVPPFVKVQPALKITPLRRSARDAERISELETQLAAANAQIISGFYEGMVPTFQQGAPTHELQSVATAHEVEGWVQQSCQQAKEINRLQEQVDELSNHVTSETAKRKQLQDRLAYQAAAHRTAQAVWTSEKLTLNAECRDLRELLERRDLRELLAKEKGT